MEATYLQKDGAEIERARESERKICRLAERIQRERESVLERKKEKGIERGCEW